MLPSLIRKIPNNPEIITIIPTIQKNSFHISFWVKPSNNPNTTNMPNKGMVAINPSALPRLLGLVTSVTQD